MQIEYNEKNKTVLIDGREFSSSFQIQKYYLSYNQIESAEWLKIIQFFYNLHNKKGNADD